MGKWDKDGVDGEKYKSMMGRVGGGRDRVWRGTGVVVCVVYWRCLKGAVVRLMSFNAPLKASRLFWVNTLDCSLFHWAVVRGKKLHNTRAVSVLP